MKTSPQTPKKSPQTSPTQSETLRSSPPIFHFQPQRLKKKRTKKKLTTDKKEKEKEKNSLPQHLNSVVKTRDVFF